MSDQARDYVKHLDNGRLRPPQKSFPFFLADYHNIAHSSAWPPLQTLAEDTGLSLRYLYASRSAKALLKEMLEANT